MPRSNKIRAQQQDIEQRKALFGKLFGANFVRDALTLPADQLQERYHAAFRRVGVDLVRGNPDVQAALVAHFPNARGDGVNERYYLEMSQDKVWVDNYILRAVADGLNLGLNFEDTVGGQTYNCSNDKRHAVTLVHTANSNGANGHFQYRDNQGQIQDVSPDGNCGPRAIVGAVQDHIRANARLYETQKQQSVSSYPQMTAMLQRPLPTTAQIEKARASQQALYEITATKPSANAEQQRLQAIDSITDKDLKASIEQQIAADEALALQLAAEYAEEDAAYSPRV